MGLGLLLPLLPAKSIIMKDIQIKYKRETGNSPLGYMSDFVEYDEIEETEIHTPDYVNWLEEKVETLLNRS